MSFENPAWYVVQAKARQEYRAEDNLRAWGIETFLPKLVRRVLVDIKTVTHVEPLFPGYLFARFDATAMLGKVRFTRGVTRVVGTEEGPSRVPDDVIAAIRIRIDPTGHVRLMPALRSGDHVRITGGPLRGLIGVFAESATSEQRVSLLLSAVNGQVRVTIYASVAERLS